MLPVKSSLTLAYALSGVLVVLLFVSSVAGLVYGGRGLYEAYPSSLAGLVGQDMVTLAVVLPLLVASVWSTRRGSTRGLLLWAGTLFWIFYFYFFYVFGAFNALFLVYVATVSASLFGLLSLLFAIDPEALRDRFGGKTPTRLAGGFCLGVSLLFALMWGGMVLWNVAAGTRPDEVLRSVVIIDLTVMLPLLFSGGILLWHRAPWGYVLGGLLLTKLSTTGFTLAFTTALGALWAGTIDPFQVFLSVLFVLMMAGGLALLVPYLRGIDEAGKKTNVGREIRGGY